MLHEELLNISFELQEKAEKLKDIDTLNSLNTLEETVNEFEKSWSGSFIGFHAYIYYKNFEKPPASAHFSTEWGLKHSAGEWYKYTYDEIEKKIYEKANTPNLNEIEAVSDTTKVFLEDKKLEILSILSTYLSKDNDNFILSIKDQIEKLEVFSQNHYINYMIPRGQIISRDSDAILEGKKAPVHKIILAEILSIKNPFDNCGKLAHLAKNAGAHIQRKQQTIYSTCNTGTNIFIGHGRSLLWRELKDFIQDRLNLPWDEFNRVPVAGTTNITRLSEMLDAAAIAFIIMTAEDQQDDGKFHPRMNVIHEAGLFQGKLGFSKAIVLLEDECEEFSNINGLGQIRFPKGNIKASFEEIRAVLEREKIIESQN